MQEASVWIAINGTRRSVLSCSPSEREALALGHLLAEGWITEPADVLALSCVDGPGGAYGVEALVRDAPADAALALHRHRTEHGCGLRHTLDCAPPPLAQYPDPVAGDVSDATIAALFRPLFAAADEASPAGGIHAVAISDGTTLLHLSIDVARHCAVDRALGLALLAGTSPAGLGLVSTARISGAIALKCARAGLRWIASRSIATSLAHELAAAHGLRLIERAARRGQSTERNT